MRALKYTFTLTTTFLTLAFTILTISVYAASENGNKPENPGGQGRGRVIKSENNKLKVSSVDEEGQVEQEEFEDELELQIEDNDDPIIGNEEEGEDDTTTVKANGNAALVIKNKLSAQTNFPLRVNDETNELIVITPKGEKIVTILPDKAVENMLAANVLDEVGGKGGYLYRVENTTATSSGEPNPTSTASAAPSPTASGSGETAIESDIQLELLDSGELAYRINGKELRKLFRLFDIKISKSVLVSAETGDILDIEQSLLSNLLEALSSAN